MLDVKYVDKRTTPYLINLNRNNYVIIVLKQESLLPFLFQFEMIPLRISHLSAWLTRRMELGEGNYQFPRFDCFNQYALLLGTGPGISHKMHTYHIACDGLSIPRNNMILPFLSLHYSYTPAIYLIIGELCEPSGIQLRKMYTFLELMHIFLFIWFVLFVLYTFAFSLIVWVFVAYMDI